MPLGKLKPLTPRTGGDKNKPNPKTALMTKYGFDQSQAQTVIETLKSDFLVLSFCRMSLHIKALGFSREDIAGLVQHLGENALDLDNWKGLKGIPEQMETSEMAYLAYMAGLTAQDIPKMSESELSRESLTVMASLRAL